MTIHVNLIIMRDLFRLLLAMIETNRLFLKPRTLEYLDDCLEMDRDPEVTRYIPGPWDKPEEHIAFIKQRMAMRFPEKMGYYVVLEKSSQRFLGWVMLLPFHQHVGVAEIGWRFTRQSWGFGYATEAALELKKLALELSDIHTLLAEVMLGNEASISLCEKLGLSISDAYKVEHQLYVLKVT